MYKPLDLALFPSCFGAIDWSADGELAIAAGEQIHIMTWRPNRQNRSEGWQVTRIQQVNLFTVAEWPMIWPQDRQDFSVGAEQSPSNVVGIAWSSPGLARYRRCALAVLTSNLLLSLWEPVGTNGQWVRVCIINHALLPTPGIVPTTENFGGADLRRFNIRSFQWCPPLHVPQSDGSTAARSPEARWGVHLLAVTTDANEVVFLRVHRPSKLQASYHTYLATKLGAHPVDGAEQQFQKACPGSLFRNLLQSKSRLTALSCGPWLELGTLDNGSGYNATTSVAVIYGIELRMLQVTIALSEADPEQEVTPRHEVMVDFKDHRLTSLAADWAHHRMVGPLKWLHTAQSENIVLAVSALGTMLTISCPRSIYNGSSADLKNVAIQEWPCSSLPTTDGKPFPRHMEPVTSLFTTRDEENTLCTLHMGTYGGLGAAIDLDESGTLGPWRIPRWMEFVQSYREGYDLDHNLRGYNTARVWGLTTYRGQTAIIFTINPTSVIEYRLISAEGTLLGFIDETTGEPAKLHTLLMPNTGEDGEDFARQQRGKVIKYMLSGLDQGSEADHENQKLIYTAACCAIADGQTEHIRGLAREALERLATITGADLSDEISKCDLKYSTIPAITSDRLVGTGGHLFERCEICDAGLTCYSAKEAQCENGHLFVRCGFSFLAIQEPGVSKYCPICRTEYLDEDLLARARDSYVCPTFMQLAEAFDTCVYCDMKFQASIQDQ